MDFHLFGWTLAGGTAVAAAVAVAWYFPPFRKYAIAAALVILGVLGIYRSGYKKGGKQKQKEWNNAIERDVKKGKDARSSAERDVHSGRVSNDEWDRDRCGL